MFNSVHWSLELGCRCITNATTQIQKQRQPCMCVSGVLAVFHYSEQRLWHCSPLLSSLHPPHLRSSCVCVWVQRLLVLCVWIANSRSFIARTRSRTHAAVQRNAERDFSLSPPPPHPFPSLLFVYSRVFGFVLAMTLTSSVCVCISPFPFLKKGRPFFSLVSGSVSVCVCTALA